jgi:hypothetical protein
MALERRPISSCGTAFIAFGILTGTPNIAAAQSPVPRSTCEAVFLNGANTGSHEIAIASDSHTILDNQKPWIGKGAVAVGLLVPYDPTPSGLNGAPRYQRYFAASPRAADPFYLGKTYNLTDGPAKEAAIKSASNFYLGSESPQTGHDWNPNNIGAFVFNAVKQLGGDTVALLVSQIDLTDVSLSNHYLGEIQWAVHNAECNGLVVILTMYQGWIKDTPHGIGYDDNDAPDAPSDPGRGKTSAAWQTLARTFGNDQSVIFELYNEPWSYDESKKLSWATWRTRHQAVLDKVRSTKSQRDNKEVSNVIMVDGNGLSLNGLISNAGNYTLQDRRVIYSDHPYTSVNGKQPFPGAVTTKGTLIDTSIWDRNFGYVAGRYPLFVSAWQNSGGSCRDGSNNKALIGNADAQVSQGRPWNNLKQKHAGDGEAAYDGTRTPTCPTSREMARELGKDYNNEYGLRGDDIPVYDAHRNRHSCRAVYNQDNFGTAADLSLFVSEFLKYLTERKVGLLGYGVDVVDAMISTPSLSTLNPEFSSYRNGFSTGLTQFTCPIPCDDISGHCSNGSAVGGNAASYRNQGSRGGPAMTLRDYFLHGTTMAQ